MPEEFTPASELVEDVEPGKVTVKPAEDGAKSQLARSPLLN